MFDFPGAMQRKTPFIPTKELLQKHSAFLYLELEPRKIADKMFQEGHLTLIEHGDITELRQKYKRLRVLLDILKKKNYLYEHFWCTLQPLKYTSVLETLQTDKVFKNELCK